MTTLFPKIILLSIIASLIPIISANPPPDEVLDLINPFSSCLLVLYDYSEANWTINSLPIVRVKLKVTHTIWSGFNGEKDILNYNIRIDRNSSSPPIAYRPTYLPCTFEFHLFPPIHISIPHVTMLFTDRMRVPHVNIGYAYIGRLEDFTVPYKISEKTFHKILVTNVTNPVQWGAWATPLYESKRRYYAAPSLFSVLVLQDRLAFFGPQFYFLCELCTHCHAKFIRLYLPLTDLIDLNLRISTHTQTMVDKTWRINHLALNDPDIDKQERILRRSVRPNGRPRKYLNFKKYDSRQMNLDLILFKLAFNNATMTGFEGNKCVKMPLILDNSDDVKYSKLYVYVYPGSMTSGESNMPCVLMDLFMGQTLTYKMEGLEFTTCHQKSSATFIGVSDMVTPLDCTIWILILASCGTICAILSLGYFLLGRSSSSITVLLFVGCGSLLEQSNAPAKNQSTISTGRFIPTYANFAYILCGTWILAGLVLSTLYKSGYVKRLTVPPKRATYTDFQELIHNQFSVYTIPYDASVYIYAINQSRSEIEVARYGNWLSIILVFEYLLLGVGVDDYEYKLDRYNSSTYKMLQRLKNITKIPHNYVEISNGNSSFADLISDCHKPLALASWTDHINQVHAHLQAIYPHSAISKSLDPLGKLMKGWALFNWGNDIVLSRISGLMSSGLADKWYQLSKEKSVTKYIKIAQRFRQTWSRLKLGKNLVGILILFLVSCGISIAIFGMEILIFKKRRTKVSYYL
ncbi:hypothetical protein Fcan01_01305 [Folsomia candida]|uniref:Uncharacterized protein n=1 Tax=Folsomia candida TaxID=158441 RepID=A0A226F6M3_FOLCA|nr:hypothetical protein Fcan01_01305 [Folsomia candida]